MLACPFFHSPALAQALKVIDGAPPRPFQAPAKGEEPVDLTAENMTHDETAQTITASGHVSLKQAGRVLKADQVVYNLSTDTATATGHVVLGDRNGDLHFADMVSLTNQMKDGFVESLQSYLIQGGRFSAKEGRRENAKVITMRDATYTACDCEKDPDRSPAWQIRAGKIRYDEDAHKVTYRNATFDVMGVPVLWTPYFFHPDGQVKRKSGFLTPVLGYDSQLGANITQRYYWSMADDHDATLGVMAMTDENPLALGEYRQRFDQGEIKLSGSATSSSRTDRVGDTDVRKKDEARGHLFGTGRWDINDKWRSGFKVQAASDDQYLRQYDISSEDVLENELYVERFSGRNYASARAMAFQDVRVDEDQTDQPNVLPEITASFKGEPNATLGGRWDADVSALGLTRFGNEQDVGRLSARAGWQRRILTGFGVVTTADVSVRGDVYQVADRAVTDTDPGRSDDSHAARLVPQLHVVTSYPFVKPMEKMQAIIEPLASVTASTNIDNDSDAIPNEDSQDVQIDANSLFQPDRFPGYDRVEDRTHATYGIRSGLYGYEGSYGSIFLGQSYRFHNDDNPFPRGSGLSRQASDYVGEVAGMYNNRFGLNYRFQLSSDTLSSQRHELEATASWNRVDLSSRYLFAKALEDTDIDENRQQFENSAAFRLSKEWKLRTGALYDLGESPGLRKAVLGADYTGCCLTMSLTAVRNLTTDSSGDAGTDITFRLGLKGLGDEL